MSHLTLIDGGASKPKPFSMNAHGVAKFMLAGAYAARKVIEGYAFPNEEKPKIILPVPAKEIVWNYFKGGRSEEYLDGIISANKMVPPNEKAYDRGRRRSVLAVAEHLKHFGGKFAFSNLRRPRAMALPVSGLNLRASVDFVCQVNDGRSIAVIFNVTSDIGDDESKLNHFALVECEIAWQITRSLMPDIAEIWYIDALTEQPIRKHVKGHKTAWRNIETTCDDIVTTYRTILSRRQRLGTA
jgi:hypothetical protein